MDRQKRNLRGKEMEGKTFFGGKFVSAPTATNSVEFLTEVQVRAFPGEGIPFP